MSNTNDINAIYTEYNEWFREYVNSKDIKFITIAEKKTKLMRTADVGIQLTSAEILLK